MGDPPSDVLSGLNVGDARRVEHLRSMLALAVPGLQQKIAKTWHPAKRAARAAICARELGQRGDVLLFGGRRSGQAALAFEYLSEAVALASLQEGGVSVLGLHFEAAP